VVDHIVVPSRVRDGAETRKQWSATGRTDLATSNSELERTEWLKSCSSLRHSVVAAVARQDNVGGRCTRVVGCERFGEVSRTCKAIRFCLRKTRLRVRQTATYSLVMIARRVC
jgi:hypothetical protein